MEHIHKKYSEKGLKAKGPLGFPCTDEQAFALEEQLKAAEAEGLGYIRAFVTKATGDFVDGERASIDVITDESIDRDNEVVMAKGMDAKQYRKNPVVVWAHDYSQPPVAKSLWIKNDGDRIRSKTVFPKRPEGFEGSFFPDVAWALVRGDENGSYLPGRSIGFMPDVASSGPPTTKEIEGRPELASAKRVIRKATLYEYSICAVPCNQNALQIAVNQKGLILPDYIKTILGLMEVEEESCIVWDSKDFAHDLAKVSVPKEPEPVILEAKDVRRVADIQRQLSDMVARLGNADDVMATLMGRV